MASFVMVSILQPWLGGQAELFICAFGSHHDYLFLLLLWKLHLVISGSSQYLLSFELVFQGFELLWI